MGVFLSKPSVEKFSEDGEDSTIQFGLSSMQGWRKNMEDAHLAVLNLEHPSDLRVEIRLTDREEAAANGEGRGGKGGEAVDKGEAATAAIRMFGVFDGHGGKEVALFVQQHIATELVKLDEYKGGDFPGALTRSFHRMDEMLEVAAAEMRRRKQEQASLEMSGAGGTTGRIEGFAAPPSPLSVPAGDSPKEEGWNGGVDGVDKEEEDPVASAMVEELSLFRARKNPSDMEPEEPSSFSITSSASPPPTLANASPSLSSENDDGKGGGELHLPKIGDKPRQQSGANSGSESSDPIGDDDGDGNDDDDEDEDGDKPSEDGGGRAERVTMCEALELFSRILNISNNSPATSSSNALDHDEDGKDATTEKKGETLRGDGGAHLGGEQGLLGLEQGEEEQNENGVADTFGDEDSEDDEDQGDAVEVDSSAAHLGYWRRNPSLGSSKANNHGGSQIDHDDDDDVVRVGSGGTAAAQGLAGKPPLGLKANSLASMIVGSETPTCQLQDHPIQAGCTSVVCLMEGKTLHVANAGDSRAVMCRGGKALDLSKDHKPTADTEKSRIEGAGGFVNGAGRVNGNLNLSRSIGDLKYKANDGLPPADQMITAEPDVRSVLITDDDRFIILACDGVWDCMTSQQCVDFVGERVGKMSVSKICEEVMDQCLSEDPRQSAGVGGDNMTCLVVLMDKKNAGEQRSGEQQGGEEDVATESECPSFDSGARGSLAEAGTGVNTVSTQAMTSAL